MYAQLRKFFGLALLCALVFGMVSEERAVAQTTLDPVDCPGDDTTTIMVDTDTFLTVDDADKAAKDADPPEDERQRTMQELFDCAIAKPGSTVQFADGTYDDVGRITVGNSTDNDGDDPDTNDVEKVTLRGNSSDREAVKFTGEVNFRVHANNVLMRHITFENTENIELLNWPRVTETLEVGQDHLTSSTCRENVEIRNCVFRNTRSNGVLYNTGGNKTCASDGFTVADSLFESIGYNNEWEEDYGPGDVGSGIPEIVPATISGATTHMTGTTPHHVSGSHTSGIRITGNNRIKNVTITGNTINGTTHSGMLVHRVTGDGESKIEISDNIVNNVPKSGIHVLERPTRTAAGYALDIKNNLVVNSGTSPWLVTDYGWYAEGLRTTSGRYYNIRTLVGGAGSDDIVDRVLKPEIWSYTENTVKDETVIFASDEPPVNIYDNFGGAGDPTSDRTKEYNNNNVRHSTLSSIPSSGHSSGAFTRDRASSCIDDDDTTSGVNEEHFACFSVVRFLDPHAAGAIQLNGVSTSGTVEITQNELRDNTLGLIICGAAECYFDNPYSVITRYSRNNAAFAKPNIRRNNIYGESAMSATDRAGLPRRFAMGAVYASIGQLSSAERVSLDGNYLGTNPRLFTNSGRRSLNEASEYNLETARLDDIRIPSSLLELRTATITGNTLTLTYSGTLDEETVPEASDFTVMVGGSTGPAVTTVSVSGAAVTLTLASAVAAGDAVTVSYTPAGNPIRDAFGANVAELTDNTVTNNTSPPRRRGPTGPVQPTPLALTSAAVAGDTLTLTYNKTLDSGSVPATEDFTIMVNGEERNISMVSVSGAAVTLTLVSAVAAGDAVTVSYTPGDNPIRDASGENAATLTDDDRTTVSNNTSKPGPPGGGGSSSGGGCALASGGSGVDLGMLLALMAVPFGFATGGREREAR